MLVAGRRSRAPLRSLSDAAGRARRRDRQPVGPNGAGKTNLLEALYFALTGRSFRTARPPRPDPLRRLARPAPRRAVRGEDGIERTLLASVSRTEGRRHLLDGNPADPATLARSRPPVAVFSPDRLTLVKGPPAERRAHLDGFVAARWPSRGGAAPALRPGAGPAQRAARPGRRRRRRRRRARRLGRDARRGRRGADRGPRRGGRRARPAVRRGRRRARPRRAAPRSSTRRGPRGSAAEIRAGLAERRDADLRLGRSSWGPHLDELKIAGRRGARCAATARRANSGPRCWP